MTTISLEWLAGKASVHQLLTEVGFLSNGPEEPLAFCTSSAPLKLLYAWPEYGPELSGFLIGTTLHSPWTALCRLDEPSPRGHVLSALLAAFRKAFPDERPPALWIGCSTAWADHETAVTRLVPGMPSMHVDGEFFAVILRRVRRLARRDPAAMVEITKEPGQCVVVAGGQRMHAPAAGPWFVSVRVAAGDLAGLTVRRRPACVTLALEPGILAIGGHTFEATWADDGRP